MMNFYCQMDAAGSLQECFSQCAKCASHHTPGPWEISRDAVPPGHVQVTVYAEADGERVATAFRAEANAHLIAAAPDLLATLEATLPALILLGDYIGNEFAGKIGIEAFDRCAIIGAARDAIAKARGQS